MSFEEYELVFDIGGMVVANITPFTEDGTIDEKALMEHVDFLITKGVQGLFTCGTYGEGPAMSLSQRKKTLEIVVKTVDNRVPVIAEIGTMRTAHSVDLNKYAKMVGVDAVASIPPWYYHHDEHEIMSYYSTVASATDLPFLVYNNPARTGINLTPELLAKLTDKIDNLIGIKDSCENLTQFSKYIRLIDRKDFMHIIGSDDITLGGLMMGAQGAVVVLANVFPELHLGLFHAFNRKDLDLAHKIQHKIHTLRDILRRGPYISMYKHAIDLTGRRGGYALRPLRPVSKRESENLKRALEALEMI